MTDWTVGDVRKEDECEGEFLDQEYYTETQDQINESSESGCRLPVDILEAWVGHVANHEHCDRQKQSRQENG